MRQRWLNGHIAISPEMAIRLAIVFNTSEELWINMQSGYDLWKANQKRYKLKLIPFYQQKFSEISSHLSV